MNGLQLSALGNNRSVGTLRVTAFAGAPRRMMVVSAVVTDPESGADADDVIFERAAINFDGEGEDFSSPG